jgi:hypothetical protein
LLFGSEQKDRNSDSFSIQPLSSYTDDIIASTRQILRDHISNTAVFSFQWLGYTYGEAILPDLYKRQCDHVEVRLNRLFLSSMIELENGDIYQKLRLDLVFAVNILHEFAHVAAFVRTLSTDFEARIGCCCAWSDGSMDGEAGAGLEIALFGARLQAIDLDFSVSQGVMLYYWAGKNGRGMVRYRPVAMSWVIELFKESFWELRKDNEIEFDGIATACATALKPKLTGHLSRSCYTTNQRDRRNRYLESFRSSGLTLSDADRLQPRLPFDAAQYH